MQKRNLVIIIAAAIAAIIGLIAYVLLVIQPFAGGTPIIIKGFGDEDRELAIEGSPDGYTQGPIGKDHHLRNWPISKLYVLDANRCVEYQFGEQEPRLGIWVNNNLGTTELDIDLSYSNGLKRMDLFFDDYDVYILDPDSKYRRKLPRAIKKVTITAYTECRDKAGTKIECPSELTDLRGEVTIGVNR